MQTLQCATSLLVWGHSVGVKNKNGKVDMAVRKRLTATRTHIYHTGSDSVTCHLVEVAFPPLHQPKLVLDLATSEGCKAELTYGSEFRIRQDMICYKIRSMEQSHDYAHS